MPPLLAIHASAEKNFAELWHHELRWGATVRGIVPAAYAASVIAMPLPLAALGTLMLPSHIAGAIFLLVAIAARLLIVRTIDRQVGERTASAWLLPLRDCLTFVVFIASFFVRSVDWRGKRRSAELPASAGGDHLRQGRGVLQTLLL